MSIWTHVSGLIRVDSLRFVKDADPTLDKIYEILGKQISYNEVWDEDIKSHIPCGSEGSIQYQVITNPDLSAIAAYTIPIWGDLRDYDSIEEIKNWFDKITSSPDLMIRQAVITVECEDGKKWVGAN